jgi:hypothetical protein
VLPCHIANCFVQCCHIWFNVDEPCLKLSCLGLFRHDKRHADLDLNHVTRLFNTWRAEGSLPPEGITTVVIGCGYCRLNEPSIAGKSNNEQLRHIAPQGKRNIVFTWLSCYSTHANVLTCLVNFCLMLSFVIVFRVGVFTCVPLPLVRLTCIPV